MHTPEYSNSAPQPMPAFARTVAEFLDRNRDLAAPSSIYLYSGTGDASLYLHGTAATLPAVNGWAARFGSPVKLRASSDPACAFATVTFTANAIRFDVTAFIKNRRPASDGPQDPGDRTSGPRQH